MLDVQHSPAVSEFELTAVVGVVAGSNDVPGAAKSTMDNDGRSQKWLVALVMQEDIKPGINSHCSDVKVTGSSEDTTEEDSMKCLNN